jgi:hypothetical protein
MQMNIYNDIIHVLRHVVKYCYLILQFGMVKQKSHER